MSFRIIAIGICILFLTGCKPTFTYNHVAYSSCEAALTAAQQDAQQKLSTVKSRPSPVNCSAKVVIPTFKKIGIDGVYRRGSPDLAQVNYVAKVIYLGFRGMGAALVKRNLFTEVDFREAFDTQAPDIGDHDFLIWLDLNERGMAHWYMLSKVSDEKIEIPVDLSLAGVNRLATWLANIEQAVAKPSQRITLREKCKSTKELSSLPDTLNRIKQIGG